MTVVRISVRCCLVKLHVHAGGGVQVFRAVSLLNGGIVAAIAFVRVLAAHAIVIVRRIAPVHPLIFSAFLLRSRSRSCAVLPCPLPAGADTFDKIVARLLVARCYMLCNSYDASAY